MAYTAYSEDKHGVIALFEDGIEVTDSMLVGSNGSHLSVLSHFVELESIMQSRLPLKSLA